MSYDKGLLEPHTQYVVLRHTRAILMASGNFQ